MRFASWPIAFSQGPRCKSLRIKGLSDPARVWHRSCIRELAKEFAMSSFYRLEFVRGPHDGLVVEENTMVGPRLRLPVQPSAANCPPPAEAAPLYELSGKGLRWEEGTPQAVLRYEFRGEMTRADAAGHLSMGSRVARWLADRRHRLGRWMMAPIDYPMKMRS
jgi:hypothetical protein